MRKLIILFAIVGGLMNAGYAQIATYIKILDSTGTQVLGESTSATYANQIEALSFGQENNSCGITSASGGSCVPKSGRFSFTLNLERSIPRLKRALFYGEMFTSIDITFVKPGATPQKNYTIRLENVLVAACTDGKEKGGTTIACSFDLEAAKIGWSYPIYGGSGAITGYSKFGWDVVAGTEWAAF